MAIVVTAIIRSNFPFFRAKNTRSIKGHGVGLALSKAIIEKMGGKVSVHSIEGEGTTLDIKV